MNLEGILLSKVSQIKTLYDLTCMLNLTFKKRKKLVETEQIGDCQGQGWEWGLGGCKMGDQKA